MNEYNYQQMVEQSLGQYDRLLISDPDEQEELGKRIEFLRQHSKMLNAFKSAIKNSCHVAGSGTGQLASFTETVAMELYLDEVQEEIFLRVAKAERAMELDAEKNHQLQ
ncbi:hypothetical protein [Yersinia enterocolitica]|uniref:hypothetical protein n=1 Tax=Yersinia enterocolitica TaxID=630 RepID=UPI0009F6985D|nr:hypothetical protein [Yersinia enterocolitica]PNM18893.1 hypothetical protein A6J65_008405 [Yersinia enterocolitica]HDL7734728.1 hypothetical protein [Yersinia enterocolitica]HDL8479345.1 hypothetical protein [Yersinia enterocolitica]HDL8507666.1 hypothetical protein [Yersinia enterocolitica]HEK6321218.1 hypothetical protein [Yersinia enterocolitica]